MERVKVIAPSTVSNFGSGFDVFAMALKEPYDTIEVELSDNSNIELEVSGYDVPKEPRKNTAGYVALRMVEKLKLDRGVKIRCNKGIRPSMGLGSSSASAAGTAYCINKLFKLGLTTNEVIEYAALGEIVSAGANHLDNVSAAILGGFTVIASRESLDIIHIDPPTDLGIVIAMPEINRGPTKLSREAVPRQVSFDSSLENIGYASTLAMGVISKNIDFIKKGMNDVIVEPSRVRYGVFKEFNKLKAMGKELNAGIAGCDAGPSIIGIIEMERKQELADRMKEIFQNAGITCETFFAEVGEGVKEVE